MLALLPLAVARPFVGVLLWSWISFMNPHQLLWGTASGLPWAALVFGATVFGCVVAGEPKRLAVNAVTMLLLVLMACFTLTSVAALAPAAGVWAKWELTMKVLLVLLLTASLLTDRWRVHALVWIMVLSIGYYGVRGGVFTLINGGNFRVWGPPNTMIADNNHLAAALLVALPLMNYLRMHSRHAAVRWALAGAAVLTLLAALGSQSRGALLGLGAATVVMWLRSRHKMLSGVVLAVCMTGAVSFMPDSWTQRMNTIQTYEADASATDRLVLWGISLKLALDRPLVGSGFTGPYNRAVVDRVEPSGPARAVHSIWFELLGEQGFPTFLAWFGLTLAGFWYAWRLVRLTRDRPDLAWACDLGRMAQVSIIAYLVSGSFLSLSYWDFYWTLLVVVGATHALAIEALRQDSKAGMGAGWRPSPAVEGAPAQKARPWRPAFAGRGAAQQ